MNTRTYLAIFLIAASIAIGTISSIATQAFAADDPARKGLDKADDNIHKNTDSTPNDLSKQDLRFHEGICQGGHSTTVVDDNFGGCDNIPAPGGKNP